MTIVVRIRHLLISLLRTFLYLSLVVLAKLTFSNYILGTIVGKMGDYFKNMFMLLIVVLLKIVKF